MYVCINGSFVSILLHQYTNIYKNVERKKKDTTVVDLCVGKKKKYCRSLYIHDLAWYSMHKYGRPWRDHAISEINVYHGL